MGNCGIHHNFENRREREREREFWTAMAMTTSTLRRSTGFSTFGGWVWSWSLTTAWSQTFVLPTLLLLHHLPGLFSSLPWSFSFLFSFLIIPSFSYKDDEESELERLLMDWNRCLCRYFCFRFPSSVVRFSLFLDDTCFFLNTFLLPFLYYEEEQESSNKFQSHLSCSETS